MTFVRYAITALGLAVTVLVLNLLLSHPLANIARPAFEAFDGAKRIVLPPQ